MNLLADIESAAARAASVVPLAGEVDPDIACHDFVRTEYWARMKAALLAAQDMDRVMRAPLDSRVGDLFEAASNKFREAMNGKA